MKLRSTGGPFLISGVSHEQITEEEYKLGSAEERYYVHWGRRSVF